MKALLEKIFTFALKLLKKQTNKYTDFFKTNLSQILSQYFILFIDFWLVCGQSTFLQRPVSRCCEERKL